MTAEVHKRALEGVLTHQFLASGCLQYLKPGKPTSPSSFNNLLSNRYFQYLHKPMQLKTPYSEANSVACVNFSLYDTTC